VYGPHPFEVPQPLTHEYSVNNFVLLKFLNL
ncbi:hypothetical protein A2U01_0076623, partial [Trifolium medium]|nr:hypothetical protein [Trifolium medium]